MHASAGGLWAGLRGQKPSLGPVAGKDPETPGQAAKVRPVRLGGPGLSAFGFRLSACGLRLAACGLRRGWTRASPQQFSGKPFASCLFSVRNRPRRAPVSAASQAPKTALISLLL